MGQPTTETIVETGGEKMKKRRQPTPFGVEVKKALLDRGIKQKEFCEEYNIPMNRLSEMLYGDRPGYYYRREIAKVLGINIPA